MSSRGLARVLLRLYPRPWRERYGDELLAYLDDSGLTPRGVVDIVAAAAVERGRSILDAAHAQIDPSPLPVHDPPVVVGADTMFGPTLVRATLVGATVVAFYAAGVPYPQWTSWFNLLLSPMSSLDRSTFNASVFDRGVASFVWFAVSLVLVLIAQMLAAILLTLGVPAISEEVAFSAMAIVLVSATLRGIWRGVRSALRPATFDPISTREVRIWQAAGVATMVVAGLGGLLWQVLWPIAMIFNMAITFPPMMSRGGEARRRIFAPPSKPLDL